MDYPNKTITIAGNNLLAATSGTVNGPVIDKAIISPNLPKTNAQLPDVQLSNIPNSIPYKINTVKHQGNTTQPEITINNDNFNSNLPINTIGLLGHAANEDQSKDILFIVATATDDPFIMPKHSETKFDLSIALPFAFSSSDNVTIQTTEAGTVTEQDFANYKNEESASMSNATSDVSSLASSIGSYGSSGNFTGAISKIEDDIFGNMGSITNNNLSVEELSNSVSNNASDIASINNKLSNQNGNNAGNVSILNNSLTQLSSQESTDASKANSNIATFANSMAHNSTDINYLSSSATSNSSSISSLTASIGYYDSNSGHHTGAISEIENDIMTNMESITIDEQSIEAISHQPTIKSASNESDASNASIKDPTNIYIYPQN